LPCIALFDSGVGGLSVLSAIQQHIPNADIVYFADHKSSPYGNKDPLWLNTHIVNLVRELDDHHNLDAIVIACNTASTLCLEQLRAHIKTPIIGVVPAVKTAASLSLNQSIGVLATPATIHGQYLKDLITTFASHCQVTTVGSTELVTIAENKLNKAAIDQQILADTIQPFLKAKCDYVVLGCTHFPHLREDLSALAPHINWIDSANAIAKRCASVIANSNIALQTNSSELHSIFYSSAQIDIGLQETLMTIGFTDIHPMTQLDKHKLNFSTQ
jgi:glutamate racemase